MRLTVIGCSGSVSGRFSAASAYLLQTDREDEDDGLRTYSAVLGFDPGAMGRLLNYLDPTDLDVMVLNHLYTDHCTDIIGMQVYRRWLPGEPLAWILVYNPGDGQCRTRQLGGDPGEETCEGEFRSKQIGPDDVVEMGPMRLEVFTADHTVSYVGLRVSGSNGLGPGKATLGYTGDTDLRNMEMEMTRGIDLLLSECAFEDGHDSVRSVCMTGSRARGFARRTGMARLLLTCFQP